MEGAHWSIFLSGYCISSAVDGLDDRWCDAYRCDASLV